MAQWTRELDLALVGLIRKYWRDERWTAGCGRFIDWAAIFDLGTWPSSFTRATLKERWQENYRKWVSVNDPMKRADQVVFTELEAFIRIRAYDNRVAGGKRRFAQNRQEELAVLKRSNVSPILTSAETSFAEQHVSLFKERRFVEAYTVTIGQDSVVPAAAIAALLVGHSPPPLFTLTPTQFLLFARALVPRAMELSYGVLPWPEKAKLTLALTDERVGLAVRGATSVVWVFERIGASAAPVTLGGEHVAPITHAFANFLEARLMCLCALIRITDALERGQEPLVVLPSSSHAMLEVAHRLFRSEPALKPILPSAPLPFPQRSLADSVHAALNAVSGSMHPASIVDMVKYFWDNTRTFIANVPLSGDVPSSATVSVLPDTQRFVLVLQQGQASAFLNFLRVDFVGESALLLFSAPASISCLCIDGEVINGLPRHPSIVIPLRPAGLTELEMQLGHYAIRVHFDRRGAAAVASLSAAMEGVHFERFEHRLLLHGVERVLPRSAPYASTWQLMQLLAQQAHISSVSLLNRVWSNAHQAQFRSYLLTDLEHEQLVRATSAQADSALVLPLFWQAAVSWVAPIVKHDIIVVYDEGNKATLVRASDAPGAAAEISLADAVHAVTTGTVFVVARYSRTLWDVLQIVRKVPAEASNSLNEAEGAGFFEEWLDVPA